MNLRSFDDLDEAARIEQAMALPEAERDALVFHLLFDLKHELDCMRRDTAWKKWAAHTVTAIAAVGAAVFGGPHIPGR
jgi:hypothetical protein